MKNFSHYRGAFPPQLRSLQCTAREVFCALLLACGLLMANEATPADQNVPPGFESLSEPQTTAVDIYFGGRYITSQIATFTPDEITLTNPSLVVGLIPQVLDKAAVEAALSATQPTNIELKCFYPGQQECGSLEPEVAGVIFDSDNFRADLFISADYLSVNRINQQRFLGSSSADWSYLQGFNAAIAGSRNTDSETYNLNSNSLFAFRENRFQLLANFQDDGLYNIDTAALRRDWQGKEYQLGYFRSNSGGFQFMSDSPIRGLRIASSLDTREDLRQSAGNDLQVFLNDRSEVLLYKDGRLLGSRFYNAGNQVLDTTSLPGGAYDVTIQIREANGSVREETRFYVKSSQLPPGDQALYFFEAGELLDSASNNGLADGTGLGLFRAGYERRIGDQMSLMAGVSQVENLSSLEMGITHLGQYHDLTIGGFGASEDRRGARVNLRSQLGMFFVNANYRRIWNDAFDPDDLSDFYGESNTQTSLGISAQLPFGRIELSTRTNKRPDSTIDSHVARFDLPRWRLAQGEFYLGFQVGREEDVTTTLASLEFRFSSDHITGQFRPEQRQQEFADGSEESITLLNGVVSWNDRDLIEDQDLRFDLRARKEEAIVTYGAEMDYATQTGRLRLQTEHVQNDLRGTSTTRYNGNAFTSFMINSSNAKLGGKEQSQSALLVNVNGDLSIDSTFDVLVDDVVRGSAKPNQLLAINLRPYETYKVRIVQRGTSFVDYDQAEKEVTLYPGNVVSLQWDAAPMDVIFGRLIDLESDDAISSGLITGVAGIATTDEYGLFQAELRRGTKNLNVETLTHTCEINLPQYQVNSGVGNLGTLRCALSPKSN